MRELFSDHNCGVWAVGADQKQMIAFTPQNPYDRFADGRPKVPDDLLAKVKDLVIEEAYGAVKAKGFPNQSAGDWKILNPGKKLVGRAFTVQFMPTRPDVAGGMQQEADKHNIGRLRNKTVIDMLGRTMSSSSICSEKPTQARSSATSSRTTSGKRPAPEWWWTEECSGSAKISPTGMPAYYRGTAQTH